jgi:serine/threonine-protein kinase
MPDATPSRPSADRNLLFGILALQVDFITRDALIAAMHAWVLDKTKPLGQILVEQNALRAGQLNALEVLVNLHLEQYGDDVEKSLAAFDIPPPVTQELRNLGDCDVDASLARMPTPSHSDDFWASRPTTAEHPNAPSQRYHILRPHGKGGLGEVFIALDQELNRQVALKEIQDQHADDPQSRGRFVREAEITGGLEHPGIVPVYGLGQYGDGRPFYAMRFVQGETLKDAISRYHQANAGDQPRRSLELELRALLTRFVAVCNAMAYAHSRGVIHRDLKPSNIMLGKYGETLIVDWGLAKALADSPARSASAGPDEPLLVPRCADGIAETYVGTALGTLAYMSPEQAAGRLDQLGPASDIYSLGATLYTLLTGRRSIESKEIAEALTKAQRGDWPPPRQIKSDIPPALDAICRKAMSLRPEDRYATALEFAGDVERWLADEPVSAWPEPWSIRARRWARRHRSLMTSGVAVFIVALIGSVIGLLLLGDAAERERKARLTAQDESDKAQLNSYVAQMNLVQREYEANNIARVRELLAKQIPKEGETTDVRGFPAHSGKVQTTKRRYNAEAPDRGDSTLWFATDELAVPDYNDALRRRRLLEGPGMSGFRVTGYVATDGDDSAAVLRSVHDVVPSSDA